MVGDMNIEFVYTCNRYDTCRGRGYQCPIIRCNRVFAPSSLSTYVTVLLIYGGNIAQHCTNEHTYQYPLFGCQNEKEKEKEKEKETEKEIEKEKEKEKEKEDIRGCCGWGQAEEGCW